MQMLWSEPSWCRWYGGSAAAALILLFWAVPMEETNTVFIAQEIIYIETILHSGTVFE
jgi:hypothetical protein